MFCLLEKLFVNEWYSEFLYDHEKVVLMTFACKLQIGDDRIIIKNIKVLNLPTFINDEKEFFDLVYDDTAFRLKNLIILK